ncbi:MerR family transcriptional regulator [Anaerosporobacter faecicola]|uniref:MerR family transcriptional regulator n=1 Tax=Anaerosporobacter faecicola TaxID=2718714 RepID=UPI00143C7698|nr:MerR family transcriptional regulator [Anaerosporobacter faecicola]
MKGQSYKEEKNATLKTCKRCKHAFTYYGFGYEYCPVCKQIDEDDYLKVKDYIYEHGISKIIDVVRATGVEEKVITNYLREGRLEIPEGSSYYLECERCGTNICSGRFCKSCAATLIKELSTTVAYNEVGDSPDKQVTGKMRYLNRDNK